MAVHVNSFYHPQSATLSYIVTCTDTLATAIIDPCYDFDAPSGHLSTDFSNALIHHIKANNLTLVWLLETHAHADHISSAQYIKSKLGGKVAIGEGIKEVQQIFKTKFNLDDWFNADGSQFDALLTHGQSLKLGNIFIKVVNSPGHTSDSVSYLIEDNLFVGDTLFMPDAGTARCDFPAGSAATLYHSIQNIYSLPDNTTIWVCHDYQPNNRELAYKTTVHQQKRSNIHVNACTTEDEFIEKREKRDSTLAVPELQTIAIQLNINAGKLPPQDEQGNYFIKLPLFTPRGE
ncbi:MBL fold metallo-hydrolase [Flocculibacter collagenilyticus]|uniref:MBL fold metallo-hydrolase n=1 Tax=Flocculibacter collagenilyticus TaxID=2744479 RepID=UPI0018F5D841|nr:MBL fold metallo-hydrolase [Flocculibacter collagenilyticus]